MSEFEQTDVNRHGLFGYSYLDHYFMDHCRHPYFILVDGKYAGFVLMNNHSLLKNTDIAIAEFFIMRKYRQQCVGKRVVNQLLDTYPEVTEVSVLSKNKNGLKF
ncbi:MAG: GNAT family N-acetyltransferase [Balneolaceae bacterium]|nr:GNAT family N-acetyltransferase [Balneolaceae bacterium]